MSRRRAVYSDRTRAVCAALGTEISVARRERKWTQSELATRVGVSLGTLRAVEQGSPTVSLGVAFEAASILSIDLMGGPAATSKRVIENRRILALLPQRIRPPVVDDNF